MMAHLHHPSIDRTSGLHTSPSPPRALVLLSDLPFPPRNGNHLRYLQQLRLLDELGLAVHVVAGRMRKPTEEAGIGPVGELARAIPVGDPPGSARARLARALTFSTAALGREPADPLSYAHRRAGFDDAALACARELHPEVVLARSIFSYLVAPLRETGARVIFDIHDASPLMIRMLIRQARGANRLGLVPYLAAARRADAHLARADEIWVPSHREAAHYRRVIPDLAQVLVPNGVTVPPLSVASERTDELLLVANYAWPPNLAAADALVESILPRVRARIPTATAVLVGAGLPEDRRRRWGKLPVACPGRVDDVEPYMRRAAALVFAAPSSATTALPLKLAEALAGGVPLVTTPGPVAASGLVPGVHAVISGDVDALARGTIELMSDPARREELRAEGHAWARQNLDTGALAARLRQQSVLRTLIPAGG